ncbi:MAG: DUF2029 domain-containing protein [Xanthomonadaceae bacterium]|nr:DUF2029 domain-containing protein [Xanthomonadaceae bacterium]
MIAISFTLYTAALHFSHGHFQIESFAIIVVCIAAALFTQFFKLSDEFNPKLWSWLLVFNSLLFFTHHGILYSQNEEALALILNLRNLSLVLSGVLLFQKLDKQVSVFAIGALACVYAISKYSVITASPNPSIDVNYVMRAGTDGFLSGHNPYSLAYSNSMSEAYGYQTTFSYLPSLLYLTAPFRLLGLDPRVLLWLSELFIALGIFKIAHSQLKNFKHAALPALLFLSAPVNWFLLEQAWSDTLMIAVILWGWIFIQDRKTLTGAVVLALAAGIKQYALFLCIFVALDAYKTLSRKQFIRALSLSASTLALLILPFWIIDSSAFTQSIFGLFQNMPLRLDSMSFTTIAAKFMNPESVPDLAKHSWFLLILFALSYFIGKTWISRSFAFLSLTFLLGSHAFCNQHHLLATMTLIMGTTQLKKNESERPLKSIPWLPLGVFIFLVSRLFILFGFQPYVTDVVLYADQAQQASQGLRAYRDFFYPYPPLSLPLIYLPQWLGAEEFFSYRNIFNKVFFLIDLLMTYFTVRVAKKHFKFSEPMIFSLLCLLSVMGLLQGHLIYDRIDLGVSFFNFSLFAMSVNSAAFGFRALVSNAGVLFKFIPFFPAVFLSLLQNSKEKKPQLFMKQSLFLIPALIVIAMLENSSHPGIYKYLFEHGERGIQIESVWATPYMIQEVWSSKSSVGIDTVFGGQHLKDEMISGVVLLLSKTLGFLILGLFGVYLLIKKPKPSIDLYLLTPLSVLLIFLSTQRVLSPQFFIWLMPFLAISIVCFRNKRMLGLTLALYGLTYIGFDLGYWEFTKFNPFFVHVVALRNVVLVALLFTTLKLLNHKISSIV